jgi:hypothetical protein
MPLATDIHVRLDVSRSYDAARHQATLTLKAYVGDKFPGVSVSGATWLSGKATITTATDHNVSTGQYVTITGISPAGYNGTYQVTKKTSDSFEYALGTNPGSAGSGGTVGTCSLNHLQNLASDLSSLCPTRGATVAQDGIVINDVNGPALSGIYVGFTNSRGTSSNDNQDISITNLLLRSY